TATIDGYEFQLILAAFQGLGNLDGGNTLESGRLAELGHTIERLPSQQIGRSLAKARRVAVSLFEPEIRSQQVRITEDERGLVISLASDAFFDIGSADIRLEDTRDVLQKLAILLSEPYLSDRYFRIEGNTDSFPTGGPNDIWASNWHLGADRALNTMLLLTQFGAPESQFQILSYGEYRPIVANDTPEGRAYNRRVDVVIVSEGNL
ncbi:MAG: OmpA family protein, partial [Salinispira sp.]